MRTKSSSSSLNASEKFYINNNTLAVTGAKIVVHPQVSRRRSTRNHHIEISASASFECSQEVVDEEGAGKKKTTIQLKECQPFGDDVLSRQVRKIRETVQVKDFERLLISLTGARDNHHGRKRPPTSLTAPDKIYNQYFGAYYEILHEVVSNRMASIT